MSAWLLPSRAPGRCMSSLAIRLRGMFWGSRHCKRQQNQAEEEAEGITLWPTPPRPMVISKQCPPHTATCSRTTAGTGSKDPADHSLDMQQGDDRVVATLLPATTTSTKDHLHHPATRSIITAHTVSKPTADQDLPTTADEHTKKHSATNKVRSPASRTRGRF
jgi:hypothetical protein